MSGFRSARYGRSQRQFVVSLLTMIMLLPTALAADTYPREVAALGPADGPYPRSPWETAVAVGPTRTVSVFNVGSRISREIGYAIYDLSDPNDPNSGYEWREGIIPLNGLSGSVDPSIVYDPISGDFLAAGMPQVVLSRLAADERDFEPWATMPGAESINTDKPYMVGGEVIQEGKLSFLEYYVVAWHFSDSTYRYRRSRDGGVTWKGGEVFLNGDPNELVNGGFCAQPSAATSQDGPVYVAYVPFNLDSSSPYPATVEECEGAAIRFLRGDDLDDLDPGNPDYGKVEFTRLRDPNDPNDPNLPAVTEIGIACGNIGAFIPHRTGGYFHSEFNKFVPQLTVDPTDPNRIYATYHDLHQGPGGLTSDVDVFLQILTKTCCGWEKGSRIRVNRDPNDVESDQFMPNVTVDTRGRVHVVYYDDRNYEQDDGAPDPNNPEPRFDLFHAVSCDQGITWTEIKLVLASDPNEPALDLGYALAPSDPNDTEWLANIYFLGEYFGITNATDVWGNTEAGTSFSGTWSGDTDPDNDKAVLYFSRMSFTPDAYPRGKPDGKVNISDLAELLPAYGSCAGDSRYVPFVDFNGDGCVGLSDLGELLAHYNQSYP